jgi:tRNA threonylcarbamoyladenosine biosynthesis protein TsaB
MSILALELSTTRGSLAWRGDDSSVRRYLTWPNDRKDSGPFFMQVKAVVEELGNANRIVIGLGPGSYAGVRIAIATGIGLTAAAAASAELLGYPSICAIEGAPEVYSVIGDARRQSFFFATVRNRAVIADYRLLTENELHEQLGQLPAHLPVFSSDVLPQFQGRVEQRHPSAEVLAELAAQGRVELVRPPLEPIYLREANVTIPKAAKSLSKR